MATILVVDSYACVRQLLHEELSAEGFRVAGTAQVSSIAKWIASTKPDLVILDLFLEKQTRWDLLHDLKKLDAQLPVIVFSACRSYADDPRISLADSFVMKSLFLDELKADIAKALKQKLPSQPTHDKIRPLENTALLSPSH
jgi:DNA-binding NtrC family response regulator